MFSFKGLQEYDYKFLVPCAGCRVPGALIVNFNCRHVI